MMQVIAITLMNLRNLPSRLMSSLVVVVGIAGVAIVMIGLLSLAKGFELTLSSTGKDDRAIVLRGGATTEMSSGLSQLQAQLVKTKPGLARDPASGAMAAAEIFVIADIPKKGSDTTSNLPMRGVEAMSFKIRDEVRITAGRNMDFGKFEMIAGIKAVHEFQGLEIGSVMSVRGADWTIVGHFESGGTVHESEVWVDVQALAANLKRGGAVTSVMTRLASPAEFDLLESALESDPQLEASLIRETDYYIEQSKSISSLIENFGYFVAFIMAIGAVFAALNTMYSAVAARSVEIATLRALGFGPVAVFISTLVEALMLALIGGLIGSVLAWLAFDNYTASTMGDTFSQVSFDYTVTPEIIQRALTWSCMLGLIGGFFPAFSAVRQSITTALRGD